MRVCRNVVRDRHRIAGDTTGAGARHLLDRGAAGGEPAGAGRAEVGAELGDAVVVVADQDVAEPGAVGGGYRGVLGVVVE
jgi:hypothetical protein